MKKTWLCIFCFIFLMVATVVWAKPDSAYIDNGNGTVTDIETGLMWQQEGTMDLDWSEARSYCSGLSLAGYTDWQLPTLDELATLVDTSWEPTINPTFFPGTAPYFYWSRSFCDLIIYFAGSMDMMAVRFDWGGFKCYHKGVSHYVRAVRGQP